VKKDAGDIDIEQTAFDRWLIVEWAGKRSHVLKKFVK